MSRSEKDSVDVIDGSCPMCSKSRLLFVCRSCLLEDGIICTLLVPENKKLCKKEFNDLLTINL